VSVVAAGRGSRPRPRRCTPIAPPTERQVQSFLHGQAVHVRAQSTTRPGCRRGARPITPVCDARSDLEPEGPQVVGDDLRCAPLPDSRAQDADESRGAVMTAGHHGLYARCRARSGILRAVGGGEKQNTAPAMKNR